jgi:hypothetical protein
MIRGVRRVVGAPIEVDVSCGTCGYNLRGLTWGRACPECGAVVQPRGGLTDSLLGGDHAERGRWRVGLGLAAWCVFVAMIARMGYFLASAPGVSDPVTHVYLFVGLVNSAMWIVAVWLVTPASIMSERRWMRRPWRAARVLCFFWIVGYGCLIARYATNPVGTAEKLIIAGDVVGRLLGGVGVLCVAFILSYLAGEAELEQADRRLNAAVWLLAFPTLLAQVFPEQMAWFTLIPLGFVLFFWCWLMTLLMLGILDLHRHVRWGQRDTEVSSDRQRRIDEARAEFDAQVESTIRPTSRHPGEIPLD